MAKITETVTNPTTKEVGFTCDRCKQKIFNTGDRGWRTDNFTIAYGCGYGTELDGTRIEADLCDPCLVEIFQKEVPGSVKNEEY